MITLPEQMKIVQAVYPQTNAGAITGDYVSLKHAHKVWIMVDIQQANAATIALTLERATDVSGTGSVAIADAVPIWSNLDTAATDILVARTAAVSYTTDAGVKNKQVIFEVDSTGWESYDCLVLKVGASNVANVVSACYMMESRFPGATPPGGPSAIID